MGRIGRGWGDGEGLINGKGEERGVDQGVDALNDGLWKRKYACNKNMQAPDNYRGYRTRINGGLNIAQS